MAVVVARLQRIRHGTLHDRAKAALRVRCELAERAEVREHVLTEADDRWRLALNCGGVEFAQRGAQLKSLLEVCVLVGVDRLQDGATREDERVVLVVALAVAQHRPAR